MNHDVDQIFVLKMINENIIQLRSDVNEKIDEMKERIESHVKKDEEYWKKLDARENQLALLKGLTASSFVMWVIAWFKDIFFKS